MKLRTAAAPTNGRRTRAVVAARTLTHTGRRVSRRMPRSRGSCPRRRALPARGAAAVRGPRRHYPFDETTRHRGQRPLRERQARGHRQWQRRNRLERRARTRRCPAATAGRRPRSGCRTACWRASTTSRSPTTSGSPAPRSRDRCSRSAGRPTTAATLTATPGAGTTPHQASIAGPGASPAAQTAAAPVSLAANTWIHVAVTVKGGDADAPGQLLLYEDGAADDVQRPR